MRTRISGTAKNITKQETRALLKWIAREFRVDRYKTPLYIKLNFIENLKRTAHHRGAVIWDDDNHRPREFTMDIDAGLSKKMASRVMIHEMTHVKQYAKGELKDLLRAYSIKRWKTRWGQRLVDENKIAYLNLPWEKEAYKLEKEYYEKWKVYNSKKC